jgi:hypothetical protein
MAAPRSLSLPVDVADELLAASARAERSAAFLVLGALKASGELTGTVDAGARRAVSLDRDEEDPRDLVSQIVKLAAAKARKLSLDDAVALAWRDRRAPILAWVERVAALNADASTDELDAELRAAADAKTPPARLAELAKSAYPRVRALVAANAVAPAEVLAVLSQDGDRIVKEALARRG